MTTLALKTQKLHEPYNSNDDPPSPQLLSLKRQNKILNKRLKAHQMALEEINQLLQQHSQIHKNSSYAQNKLEYSKLEKESDNFVGQDVSKFIAKAFEDFRMDFKQIQNKLQSKIQTKGTSKREASEKQQEWQVQTSVDVDSDKAPVFYQIPIQLQLAKLTNDFIAQVDLPYAKNVIFEVPVQINQIFQQLQPLYQIHQNPSIRNKTAHLKKVYEVPCQIDQVFEYSEEQNEQERLQQVVSQIYEIQYIKPRQTQKQIQLQEELKKLTFQIRTLKEENIILQNKIKQNFMFQLPIQKENVIKQYNKIYEVPCEMYVDAVVYKDTNDHITAPTSLCQLPSTQQLQSYTNLRKNKTINSFDIYHSSLKEAKLQNFEKSDVKIVQVAYQMHIDEDLIETQDVCIQTEQKMIKNQYVYVPYPDFCQILVLIEKVVKTPIIMQVPVVEIQSDEEDQKIPQNVMTSTRFRPLEVQVQVEKKVPITYELPVQLEIVKEIQVIKQVIKTVKEIVQVPVMIMLQKQRPIMIQASVQTQLMWSSLPEQSKQYLPSQIHLMQTPFQKDQYPHIITPVYRKRAHPFQMQEQYLLATPLHSRNVVHYDMEEQFQIVEPLQRKKTVTVDQIQPQIHIVEVQNIIQVQKIVEKKVHKIVQLPIQLEQVTRQKILYELPIDVIQQVQVIKEVQVIREVQVIKEIQVIKQIQVIRNVVIQVPVTLQIEKQVVVQVPMIVEKQIVVEVPLIVEKQVVVQVPMVVEKHIVVEVPLIVEKQVIVQVPMVVQKHIVVEVPLIVKKQVVVEVPMVVQKHIVVEVPMIMQKQVIVEVPKIIEKRVIVQVPLLVEDQQKKLQSPSLNQRRYIIQTPLQIQKEVPVVIQKHIVVQVPMIIQKPVVVQVPLIIEKQVIVQVPLIVQKNIVVEVPLVIEKETIVEVPLFIQKQVDKIVREIRQVPVQVQIIQEIQIEKIVEKIIQVPVEKIVYITKIVEVPVQVQVEKIIQKIIQVPVQIFSVEKLDSNKKLRSSNQLQIQKEQYQSWILNLPDLVQIPVILQTVLIQVPVVLQIDRLHVVQVPALLQIQKKKPTFYQLPIQVQLENNNNNLLEEVALMQIKPQMKHSRLKDPATQTQIQLRQSRVRQLKQYEDMIIDSSSSQLSQDHSDQVSQNIVPRLRSAPIFLQEDTGVQTVYYLQNTQVFQVAVPVFGQDKAALSQLKQMYDGQMSSLMQNVRDLQTIIMESNLQKENLKDNLQRQAMELEYALTRLAKVQQNQYHEQKENSQLVEGKSNKVKKIVYELPVEMDLQKIVSTYEVQTQDYFVVQKIRVFELPIQMLMDNPVSQQNAKDSESQHYNLAQFNKQRLANKLHAKSINYSQELKCDFLLPAEPVMMQESVQLQFSVSKHSINDNGLSKLKRRFSSASLELMKVQPGPIFTQSTPVQTDFNQQIVDSQLFSATVTPRLSRHLETGCQTQSIFKQLQPHLQLITQHNASNQEVQTPPNRQSQSNRRSHQTQANFKQTLSSEVQTDAQTYYRKHPPIDLKQSQKIKQKSYAKLQIHSAIEPITIRIENGQQHIQPTTMKYGKSQKQIQIKISRMDSQTFQQKSDSQPSQKQKQKLQKPYYKIMKLQTQRSDEFLGVQNISNAYSLSPRNFESSSRIDDKFPNPVTGSFQNISYIKKQQDSVTEEGGKFIGSLDIRETLLQRDPIDSVKLAHKKMTGFEQAESSQENQIISKDMIMQVSETSRAVQIQKIVEINKCQTPNLQPHQFNFSDYATFQEKNYVAESRYKSSSQLPASESITGQLDQFKLQLSVKENQLDDLKIVLDRQTCNYQQAIRKLKETMTIQERAQNQLELDLQAANNQLEETKEKKQSLQKQLELALDSYSKLKQDSYKSEVACNKQIQKLKSILSDNLTQIKELKSYEYELNNLYETKANQQADIINKKNGIIHQLQIDIQKQHDRAQSLLATIEQLRKSIANASNTQTQTAAMYEMQFHRVKNGFDKQKNILCQEINQLKQDQKVLKATIDQEQLRNQQLRQNIRQLEDQVIKARQEYSALHHLKSQLQNNYIEGVKILNEELYEAKEMVKQKDEWIEKIGIQSVKRPNLKSIQDLQKSSINPKEELHITGTQCRMEYISKKVSRNIDQDRKQLQRYIKKLQHMLLSYEKIIGCNQNTIQELQNKVYEYLHDALEKQQEAETLYVRLMDSENKINSILLQKVTAQLENKRLTKQIELSEKKLNLMGGRLIEIARQRADYESDEEDELYYA